MIALGDIWLLRPWWLAAIPVFCLLALLLVRQRGGLGGWERVVEARFLPALESLGHVIYPTSKNQRFIPLAVAGALALALAGPAVRKDRAPAFQNLDAVMLVMDMSPSVTRGGSLDDAQAAAAQIIQNVGGRPVGLIVYAGEPFLVSATTSDASTLESPIAVLGPNTMPDVGSRPDRALAMARELFTQAGIIGGDVVLISDGGGLADTAFREVSGIVEDGGKVSTIFVPPAKTITGMPTADHAELEKLADAGDGIFTQAAATGKIATMLQSGRRINRAPTELIMLLLNDLGRYLVILAMIPALMLFRRRS